MHNTLIITAYVLLQFFEILALLSLIMWWRYILDTFAALIQTKQKHQTLI